MYIYQLGRLRQLILFVDCKTREIPISGKKWQNRNFGCEIIISVKNPKFIL